MQYAVIMAGGSGQRLWPLSRRNRPKQIINAFGGKSLLRLSVDRIKDIFDTNRIMVITNQEYAHVVREHLPELPPENIIGEPIGRDTANAIGLAATIVHLRNPDSMMAVFSADHMISPTEPLQQAVKKALNFLETNPHALLTFGIKATSAHTGFGYLKRGTEVGDGIYPVAAFKEKPNKSTARKYIRSGEYCWNSGMFFWRTDTILEQLNRFLPHNSARFRNIGQAWDSEQKDEVLRAEFVGLEKISIDYAVMERATDVYMCELDCNWQDVGSYKSLSDTIGAAGADGNITTETTNCEWLDSMNNIAFSDSPDHLIAAIHVEDMIIVHTEDATLICHRDETDHLKRLLEQIRAGKNKKYT
jgi:mannose-1-phosphate guanylyltransferase